MNQAHISWMPHNCSWRVHKLKLFESMVISMFFTAVITLCSYNRSTDGGSVALPKVVIITHIRTKAFYVDDHIYVKISTAQQRVTKLNLDPLKEPNLYSLPNCDSPPV